MVTERGVWVMWRMSDGGGIAFVIVAAAMVGLLLMLA